MKTLEQISKLHWQDTSGQDDLAEYIENVLETVEQPGISTTELMHRMGAPTSIMKGLANQLGTFRRDNPSYVTQQTKPGAFGKPAYRWHKAKAKPAMSDDERRAWIKANDSELFNTLYGSRPKPD